MPWTFLTLVIASAAAWLLAGAGVAKLRDPGPTIDAVRSLVPAAPHWLVPVLGLAEVAIGVAFIAVPSAPTTAALGVWYLALLGSATFLHRRDVDCGCFGASSAPVTAAHLVVCAAAVTAVGLLVLAPMDASVPAVSIAVEHLSGAGLALLAYGILGPLPMLRRSLRGLRT